MFHVFVCGLAFKQCLQNEKQNQIQLTDEILLTYVRDYEKQTFENGTVLE